MLLLPNVRCACGQKHRIKLRRKLVLLLLLASTLFLLACPKRGKKPTYDEAERGLRLAIEVNEAAYNSWHNLLEDMGKMHRNRRLSKARWASLKAIDGVIVAAEADLIVGIDRSKKLLVAWQHVQPGLSAAGKTTASFHLQTRHDEARQRFLASIGQLLESSQELRDGYAEALYVTQAVTKASQPLSRDDLKNLQALIKMVDKELGQARLSLNSQEEKAATEVAAATPPTRALNQTVSVSTQKRPAPATSRKKRKK